MKIEKATRYCSRLNIMLWGYSGDGKTYTALELAMAIAKAEGGKVGFIDSEYGRASKYVGRKSQDGSPFEFDVINISATATIDDWIRAYGMFGEEYSVIIADSATHAWRAVMKLAKAKKTTGWMAATPKQDAFIATILNHPAHTITCVRAKDDLVYEGRRVVQNRGARPDQRPRVEYEFDFVGFMENATLTVTESMVAELPKGSKHPKPGAGLGLMLLNWAKDGEAAPQPTLQQRAAAALQKMGVTVQQVTEWAGEDIPDTEAEIGKMLKAVKDNLEEIKAIGKLPVNEDLLSAGKAPTS